MSVILYTRDEILMALAATWNRGSIGSLDNLRHMDQLAEAGNRIMTANRAATDHCYRETNTVEDPITGPDIKRKLICKTVDTNLQGMRTLRGLRYNLIANDGKDFATAEVLDDLLGLFTAAFDIAQRRAA